MTSPSSPPPGGHDPTPPSRGAGPGGYATERAAFVAWVGDLVHEHRNALTRIARREGLPPEEAFDAVQEAFLTFITLPETGALVNEPDQSRGLLITLTRNVSRNHRRLHANARPHISDPSTLDGLADDVSNVEETLHAAEEHVRLAGCLLTLAEIPRTVVTLRMLDEVAGEDVARMLGVSAGHVAILLHRAKSRLLTCMTTCGDRPPAAIRRLRHTHRTPEREAVKAGASSGRTRAT